MQPPIDFFCVPVLLRFFPTVFPFCSAGFAPQDRLWAGLGALSRTINERERRHAVLGMHNAELRAAASGGDELHMLQVLLLLLLASRALAHAARSCA